MTTLLTAFDEVSRRAAILSPESYQLDGTIVHRASATFAASHSSRPPIVWQLQHHLYERCYLGRAAAPASDGHSFTDITAHMSSANPSSSRWDEGWTIQSVDPTGMILVTREGKARVVRGGEFLSTMVGVAPRVGAVVKLFVPHESPNMQPGFYFAFGDSLGDQLEELAIVRFYWNVNAEEGPALVRQLALGLNRYTVPFKLKVLSTKELFPRPDAMVLYVSERYTQVTAAVCAGVVDSSPWMRGRAVPLFTKKLADGLGAAEDPGNGESFGMSRCRVAAEGLWNAHIRGSTEEQLVTETVREHVRRYGLDPARPYLNPRSPDIPDLPHD